MMRKRVHRMLAALAAAASLAGAAEESPSIYDKIWGYTVLVDNSDAVLIQRLALTGRLQADAYAFGSSHYESNEDVDWRRFRFGFRGRVLKHIGLHAEMDLDLNETDSWDTFYKRLTDVYAQWAPSGAIHLKVGKQSAGFTLDGATSSKKLITPERSVVAANIWFSHEYFTGAALSGDPNGWHYKLGGYSASGEPEFGHFESGYFGLLSLGRKLGERGSVRIDYVYNSPDYGSGYDVGTKKLRHVASLVCKQMLGERFGIWADLSAGKGISGKGGGDLAGLEIMPFYNLNNQLQLVLQYAGVTCTDDQSIVKLPRYAKYNVDKERAETVHNLLLGFNWYLYGHKLKWQNAIEYNHGSNMSHGGEDYDGYGITSAIRLSW